MTFLKRKRAMELSVQGYACACIMTVCGCYSCYCSNCDGKPEQFEGTSNRLTTANSNVISDHNENQAQIQQII